MSYRSFNRGVCIAATLSLLVSVMTSPIRPSHPRAHRVSSAYLRRNFAASTRATRVSVALTSPRATTVKAVRTEIEEEKFARAASPSGQLFNPRESHNGWASIPARIPAGFISVSQPLRC